MRAVGWSDAALGRLVGYEGLALGCSARSTGAGLGLARRPGCRRPARTLVAVAALVAAGRCPGHHCPALVPAALLPPAADRPTARGGVADDGDERAAARSGSPGLAGFGGRPQTVTAVDDVSLEHPGRLVVALTGASGRASRPCCT